MSSSLETVISVYLALTKNRTIAESATAELIELRKEAAQLRVNSDSATPRDYDGGCMCDSDGRNIIRTNVHLNLVIRHGDRNAIYKNYFTYKRRFA